MGPTSEGWATKAETEEKPLRVRSAGLKPKPREHPKRRVGVFGETSWCGAAPVTETEPYSCHPDGPFVVVKTNPIFPVIVALARHSVRYLALSVLSFSGRVQGSIPRHGGAAGHQSGAASCTGLEATRHLFLEERVRLGCFKARQSGGVPAKVRVFLLGSTAKCPLSVVHHDVATAYCR